MKCYKTGRWLLVAILAASSSSLLAQSDRCNNVWGEPVDGLQLALSIDSQQSWTSNHPSIRVSLRNAGSSDTGVELGVYCGPTKAEPVNIQLVFTDNQTKSRRVGTLGSRPYQGGCGASTTPLLQQTVSWWLPLMPGASYSMPVNLGYFTFVSEVTHRYQRGWQPRGTYQIQAMLFTGKLTHRAYSNVLRVHFPTN